MQNRRPRILIIGTRDYGQSAVGHRSSGVMEALAPHFDLRVLYANDTLKSASVREAQTNLSRSDWALTPRWAQTVTREGKTAFYTVLNQTIRDFQPDLLLLRKVEMLPFFDRKPILPTILDTDDLLWVMTKRRLAQQSEGHNLRHRLAARIKVGIAQRYERRKFRLMDEVWVCSEADFDFARQNGYRGRLCVAANAYPHFPPILADRPPLRHTVLFVGTMGYKPNREGVIWFLKHCWPMIRARVPDAQFQVVGPWPPSSGVTLGPEKDQPGVQILGFVDDVQAAWRGADALVVPLQLGTGTRVKIIEAWAYGVPVVTTRIGIEGLAGLDGVHALVEDTPERFADAAVRLMQEADLGPKLSTEGYALARALYTTDHVGPLMAAYCWQLYEATRSATNR